MEPDTGLVNRVIETCAQHGLLVENAGTYGKCLRWMPPLVVNEQEIALALAAFGAALKATA